MRLTVFLLTLFISIALTQAYYSGWFTTKSSTVGFMSTEAQVGESVSFNRCHIGGGYNCVVDGDTIWLRGEKIRIADIDAPETHDPQCQSEKALGDRATDRLEQLLEAGTVTLQSIDRDEDRYGRKLRIVLVDGRSVGDTLVSEGLVRWYEGGRRPWC
jgi:micrococcal nuclease